MNPKEKGIITEYKIVAKLIELGYSVAIPCGDNDPYDLIVTKKKKFFKIQCKTGRFRNGSVIFNTVSCRMNFKKWYKTNYVGKIDAFVVWCPDNDEYYWIPIDKGTKSEMTLRVDKPKNNAKKRINWAKDYKLK